MIWSFSLKSFILQDFKQVLQIIKKFTVLKLLTIPEGSVIICLTTSYNYTLIYLNWQPYLNYINKTRRNKQNNNKI